MARKNKDGKVKKEKRKTNSSEEIDIQAGLRNQLQLIIEDVQNENNAEEMKFEKIMFPLTRCTSLPIVHAEPMRQSLFWDDSKSVDFGFEPNPKVPDADVVLDKNPNKMLKSVKKGLQLSKSKLSFMKSNVPDDKLLDGVKTKGRTDFLRTRVGAKNMDAILNHLRVEIDESLLPSRNRNQRILWLIFGLCAMASVLAITLSTATGGTNEVPAPETPREVPTVPEDSMPFEYIPPGKDLGTRISVIDFKLDCQYNESKPYRVSDLESHVLYGLAIAGVNPLNGYTLDELSIKGFRAVVSSAQIGVAPVEDLADQPSNHTIIIGYLETIPVLLWYGMEFCDQSVSGLQMQIYILLRDIVFPIFLKRFNINCQTELNSISGHLELLLEVGKQYQKSVPPNHPPGISDDLKGAIKRTFKELN